MDRVYKLVRDLEVWKGLLLYGTIFIMTALSVFYSYHSQRVSEQKHCNVVITFNEAFEAQEPTSEIGQKLREGYLKLERELDCKRNGDK